MVIEGTLVRLLARIEDDLRWAPKDLPERIIWELDFGCGERGFSVDDPIRLQAFFLAAEFFSKEFWRLYEAQTAGVAIYRGPEERLCLDFLQKLAERLPDELPVVILLEEVPGRAQLAYRLSRERLGSFQLAVAGSFLPSFAWSWQGENVYRNVHQARVGVYLPEESLCSESVLERLEGLCVSLEQEGVLYRVVLEAFLTEDWVGLDEIHVYRDLLTARGARKLMGFEAAGGTVVWR